MNVQLVKAIINKKNNESHVQIREGPKEGQTLKNLML